MNVCFFPYNMSVLIRKLMACFEGEDWWSQFVELENELPGFWSCVGPFCWLGTQLSNSIPALRVLWETLDGPALATFKELVAFDQKVVTFTTTCHELNWEPDSMSITCDEACRLSRRLSVLPSLLCPIWAQETLKKCRTPKQLLKPFFMVLGWLAAERRAALTGMLFNWLWSWCMKIAAQHSLALSLADLGVTWRQLTRCGL